MRFSYEGDELVALGWRAKAQQELERLQARIDALGVEHGSFQHGLDGSSYCYGRILPGISMVHVVAPPSEGDELEEIKSAVPDFVSGVSVKPRIESIKGVRTFGTFFPTPASYRLHKKEFPQGSYKANLSTRLTVDVAPGFFEFIGEGGPSPQVVLRPSLYSGRMRKVVQALQGFGVKPKKSIYDLGVSWSPAELVELNKPPTTAFEKDQARNGVRVNYDYRFPRSHGIVTATDGKAWLVEISITRGIIAMPLPINRLTTTGKFRDRLVASDDTDGLTLLDEFGGFPTGETFPVISASTAAYTRAGRIITLATPADMHPFYFKSAYSQAMGWAFNTTGSEAHNTCYDYGDDFIQTGYHYSINLLIGGARTQPTSRGKAADAVKSAMGQLRSAHPDEVDAAIYKVDWLSSDQFAAVLLALNEGNEACFDVLNPMVAAPLASGSGHLALAGSGRMIFPTRDGPQVKFPDYQLGILVSHDMRPGFDHHHGEISQVYCDTVMHVFFAGMELKYVKFYWNPEQGADVGTVTDDSDEVCRQVGTFVTTAETGPLIVAGHIYTSDFDDREERRSGLRTVSTSVGTRLGYTQVGLIDLLEYPPEGNMFRARAFHIANKLRTYGSIPRLDTGVAVPFGDREAYYYGVIRGEGPAANTDTERYEYIEDPNTYHYWRNFGGWTSYRPDGYGGFIPQGTHPGGCGVVTRRTVWFHEYAKHYSVIAHGHECDDLADEGEWASVCDDADALANFIPLPPLPASRSYQDPAFATLTVKLVNNYGQRNTRVLFRNDSDVALWTPQWFRPSPSDDGLDAALIQTNANCLGESEAVVYDDDITISVQKVAGSPSLPAMKDADGATRYGSGFHPFVTFVGVIDG